MIALLEAQREGYLRRALWLPNLLAGVVVGVVALPLAMAFAIASGATPQAGLYTAIIGGLIVSIAGGSRVQIAGPTGAFVVILAGITAKYGIDGLHVATLMAGAMLLAMGFTKMGVVIRFIPAPVVLGFTAGIGVTIWVGQWTAFFGLPKTGGEQFYEKLWQLLQVLPHMHMATTALASGCLLILIFLPKVRLLARVPAPLVALVAATAIQSVFHLQGVVTIGSAFGGIPQGLPALQWPEISFGRITELIAPAFAIAMLGAIESLLSAVVADGMSGGKHDSNQELIGQGLANIVTPLFGGIAATGAIARTATSIRNGATSPLAGIVHSVILVLIILFLAPLASDVPLAALAAILFVVAYNMSELKHFRHMLFRAPRADVAILLITFLLTVFVDLVVAVNIGVILASFQFLRRMASSVDVKLLSDAELQRELAHEGVALELPEKLMVFSLDGPFFFGAVERVESILAKTHSEPHALIIRLQRVPFMDITGLQALTGVIIKLHRRGVHVVLCEANERVLAKLEKATVLDLVGAKGYASKLAEAVALAGEI